MKNLLGYICLFGLGLFFSACDNELNQLADAKDIPVVYGVINRNDTAHFLRVEKVFVDPVVAPAELAKDPANLYYDNIQVQLQVRSTEEIYTLDRVDGASQGFPRKEGPFAQSPNYLYKLKLPNGEKFTNGQTIDLLITRGDELEIVKSSTQIVSDIQVQSPKIGLSNTIDLVSVSRVTCSFNKEDAFIFDIYLVLKYRERDAVNGGEWVSKTLDWKVGSDLVPESGKSNVTVNIPGDGFLSFLASEIEVLPDVFRAFDGVDIRIDAGGRALESSVSLSKVNGGLTSSQVTPVFNNITNGVGLFSSKNQVISEGFILDADTRDSLRRSSITAPLQFQ